MDKSIYLEAMDCVCCSADDEQDVLTEDTEREEAHPRNETGIACLIWLSQPFWKKCATTDEDGDREDDVLEEPIVSIHILPLVSLFLLYTLSLASAVMGDIIPQNKLQNGCLMKFISIKF